MRLPIPENPDPLATADLEKAVRVVHSAVDHGINYIDTAYGYCGGRSETAVGLALEGERRNRVLLSTKLPLWNFEKREDFRRILEEQLRKLRTDHVDFYHFHALGRERLEDKILPLGLLDEAEKLKGEGLFRHLAFSFHDPDPEVMKKIIDYGVFDSVLCQYNLLDRSNEDNIRYAAERGLGVFIMGPVGGGRLAFAGSVFENALKGKFTTPELALRFVLSSPLITCALSGMSTQEMVEDNCRVADDASPLDATELQALEQVGKECEKLRELYCTGCSYCVESCPRGIDIPGCLRALIYDEVYKLGTAAANTYPKEAAKRAGNCVGCGACEKKCPQHLPIRAHLARCRDRFE